MPPTSSSPPPNTGLAWNVLRASLLAVVAFGLLAITLWQSLRRRDGRLLRERLGLVARRTDRPIWIHAASVGEVIAAQPLIQGLRARHPSIPLLLTTLTPTGGEVAAKRLGDAVRHCYLPLDSVGTVGRFLRNTGPRCALILETELWPRLFAACAGRGIAPIIVNARVSARTLRAGRLLRRIHGETLGHARAVLARSEGDRQGFIELGADAAKVQLLGNIKLAAATACDEATSTSPLPAPYVLAASTHEDEELRLLRAWSALGEERPLLVIVPRHPQRGAELARRLAPLCKRLRVRSRDESVDAGTDLYLADTLGELPRFMRHARAVFMGGSLIPHGGHNLLEPARLGCALLTGLHVENFRDECAALLAAEALVQVSDEHELVRALHQLLNDDAERERLGANASAFMRAQAGIAERYLEAIERLCQPDAGP